MLDQNRKWHLSFVNAFISSLIDETVELVIKRGRWAEKPSMCLDLLYDRLDREQENYIRRKMDLKYHRDSRSSLRYAFDLVISWVIEDVVKRFLNKNGMKLYLSGGDKRREFLFNPDARPDMVGRGKDGTWLSLEVMHDFNGFWKDTKKMHMRASKFRRMTESERPLALCVDFKNKEMFSFFLEDIPDPIFIDSHKPYGGKAAYEIKLDAKDLPLIYFDFHGKMIRDD